MPPLSAAPTGPWSTIHWYDTGALPLGPTEVGIHGWSGGYIALEQSPGADDSGNDVPVVIRASSSSDGAHWSAPTTLQTGFNGMVQIRDVVEGRNGLLALAYPYGDTCGGPESLFAMWASSDGKTWKRLPMPKTFSDNQVQTISGGAAGYIAFGAKRGTETAMIWTSADARTWTVRPLPTVSSGTVVIDSAVSFDGGFALSGAVLGEGGCGGPQHIKPAIWVSPDGASWKRASLPGASTDPNSSLDLRSFGDHLRAVQYPAGEAVSAPSWTSTDGLTWTPRGQVPTDLTWGSVSDDHHTLLSILPDSGAGLPTLTEIAEDGTQTPIRQDGGGPVVSEDSRGYVDALGPTGLLAVRDDGGDAWIGLPS